MKIIVESEKNINIITLPENISGNYWITDNNLKNLLNIVEENGNWILKSNADIKISSNVIKEDFGSIDFEESDILVVNKIYYIANIVTKEKYILYTLPSCENFENLVIDWVKVNNITIGRDNSCDININNILFSQQQLGITYNKENGAILLKNLYPNNKLFVNNIWCDEVYIQPGDSIFIGGVFIYYFGSLLLVSNNNNIMLNAQKVNKRVIKENPITDYSDYVDKEVLFFDKTKYFQRPPRFKRQIEKKIFNIDPPTQKEKQEETPLIFTIAPMLTMGMMSTVSGVTALQKVLSGESTLKEQFSSLLMCVCMLIAMIIFPLVQKFYNKRKKIAREKARVKKYKKYIDDKHQEIIKEVNYQKAVLSENNLPIENVRDVILGKSRTLWERKLEHTDFLELRLGLGNKIPDIEIKYPEEHFTMEEDDLKDLITEIVKDNKEIENVPITLNFRNHNKVGIIGQKNMINNFFDNLLLQVMAYHGYDMLRIVILTNEKNKKYWEKYKSIPFLWNNDKSLRYYGTNKDDINKITGFLMEEYNYRKETSSENGEKIQFSPYYIVVTDDIVSLKNNSFISEILKSQINLGYSIIMSDDKLNSIPNECNMFINVAKGLSGIFTNQMTSDNQITFKPDIVNFSINNCIRKISNIPMDINGGKFVLPKKYGFLEMFDVGNVNQLNIINKWRENDIIKSLETPVGIDEQGELFKLDLHEKSHGPHGLVAGMTGSGKSEWIITYILSMAVNYSPEEVQFVLIDYKGGGLALTFDNRETGIKLPHVVGTLTNLDVVEMKRSLASINSELKRRQNMFKEAREKLNESSMDIYKYQELYRAGKLDEPMSHLFIISDEFAELKAQQPDFMDELISTARIGRSLGVHLILATQKPSGVVDDQIWSNSKFRVCLKVQDKTDSNDMLKRPEAAMLKDTGRFYLQVGYNEFFALGQSAYAGMPYYESDKKITLVDSTIDFVDDIGAIIKKGDIKKKNTQFVHKGEELPNVLNYIIDTAKTQELKIKPLWLGSIPSVIYVDKLKEKYNYQKENFVLNPIVGEYDEPHRQKQNLLTVPLSKEGNFLLYGASGSGKELFLTTLLYSLITTYTPEELGIYILDFGTEVLNNFTDCSHVGDIVHSGEDEKLENLFKYIKSEIDFRRKKFLQFNGSYEDFIAKSEQKIPNLVIVINQFDVFSELYNNESEKLYELTREANKFGIYFVLTSNSINGVKSKLLQTFKTIYSLQLNNEFDYRSIYGNTNGIVPSKLYGRGLFKKDRVLEFQTAYAFEKEELYKNILSTSIKTFMNYKTKMRPIPILPKEVEFRHINKREIDFDFIPVGMSKKDLGIANIKLKDELSYLISFREFDENISFIDKILRILDYSNINTFVMDAKYVYENNNFKKIKYLNNNYTEIINNLNKFVNDVDEVLKNNNNNIRSIKNIKDVMCVIIGFDKFISSLSKEDKDKFISILTKSKETLKVHFIFIDIPAGFKPYEFETWYKSSINTSSGLWLGDGFAEQYLIKPTKVIQAYYDIIGNNFGYIVENGQVKFIKILEKM
ncbi:MAG: type VII secretion protein EssC [Bacilli bacterium]|nr:type VII secretion protein EssC [Bacilli bacterium]